MFRTEFSLAPLSSRLKKSSALKMETVGPPETLQSVHQITCVTFSNTVILILTALILPSGLTLCCYYVAKSLIHVKIYIYMRVYCQQGLGGKITVYTVLP